MHLEKKIVKRLTGPTVCLQIILQFHRFSTTDAAARYKASTHCFQVTSTTCMTHKYNWKKKTVQVLRNCRCYAGTGLQASSLLSCFFMLRNPSHCVMAGWRQHQGNEKASKGDIAGHDSLRHLCCHHPSGHPVAVGAEVGFHLVVACQDITNRTVRKWRCMVRLVCELWVCDSRTALSYRTYPRRPSGRTIGTILIPAGAGPLPYIIGCNKNVDRDND